MEGEEVDEAVLVASLNLVDLAGSESVRHSGTTGMLFSAYTVQIILNLLSD